MVLLDNNLFEGVTPSQIRVICMYGYDTSLSQDIARFSYLQQKGICPFVQCYQPILGATAPEPAGYFDTDVRGLLNIHFAQNGRIFENYLKWVSFQYAKTFGKLYMPLVDLIFKYNYRSYKHKYIETLAGIRK